MVMDGPAAAAAPYVCTIARGQQVVRRLVDLPSPVREALYDGAGAVAEAGGRFNPSDVGGANKGPGQRFLQGYRIGALWLVWLEQGGIAHRYRVLGFRETRGGVRGMWSSDAGRAGSLCAASRAMAAEAGKG